LLPLGAAQTVFRAICGLRRDSWYRREGRKKKKRGVGPFNGKFGHVHDKTVSLNWVMHPALISPFNLCKDLNAVVSELSMLATWFAF
jgi:hypothetical protein